MVVVHRACASGDRSNSAAVVEGDQSGLPETSWTLKVDRIMPLDIYRGVMQIDDPLEKPREKLQGLKAILAGVNRKNEELRIKIKALEAQVDGFKGRQRQEEHLMAKWEDSAKDKAADKRNAKKAGVSLKRWEGSAADEKKDAAAAKRMKKGKK